MLWILICVRIQITVPGPDPTIGVCTQNCRQKSTKQWLELWNLKHALTIFNDGRISLSQLSAKKRLAAIGQKLVYYWSNHLIKPYFSRRSIGQKPSFPSLLLVNLMCLGNSLP